ncbi:hypothetical protein GCM10025865_16560 [Paraoerskovia sediminicola]|uniref:histidine kinase n=1 Tax=Paraoerskovia sediminicola TaxID=1138587 RepID=A0ABN6XBY5_9CELL|nr:ATP-binding protein [Paraoerskovia sediminicola]BDZ42357.1 hypothetical protein GCM10025865_16560 [Paraoerskovia sediminicola]
MRDGVRTDTLDLADSTATAAATTAWVTIGIAILSFLLSLLIAGFIASRIVRPLRHLTTAAKELQTQLPVLVEQVSVPGQGPRLSIDPIAVESSDEVGQLAEAFNDVNSTTVQVAREQAALRGSIAEMFVNVARRDQVLLNRQLAFLDDLERAEEDAGTLSNLFRLDHLATRMRRNAESLLVLAGIDSGRRIRQPMPASDVIRTASSEIELYDRVRLHLAVDPHMLGHNALNAAHLLAELIENATNFSEPHTPVEVSVAQDEHAVTITVRDHGLGMSPAELAEATRRVRTTGATDVVGAQRLGLYVVGRLAGKLQADVSFDSAAEGGTVASVTFPAALFVADRDRPLPSPTDPLSAHTQAAAGQLGSPAPSAERSRPSAPGSSITPASAAALAAGLPVRRDAGSSAPVPAVESADPGSTTGEAPVVREVDLDALTDGTTSTGMPRRRARSADSSADDRDIVLPPLEQAEVSDDLDGADLWAPPSPAAPSGAPGGLPTRGRRAAEPQAPAEPEAPVDAPEPTGAPVGAAAPDGSPSKTATGLPVRGARGGSAPDAAPAPARPPLADVVIPEVPDVGSGPSPDAPHTDDTDALVRSTMFSSFRSCEELDSTMSIPVDLTGQFPAAAEEEPAPAPAPSPAPSGEGGRHASYFDELAAGAGALGTELRGADVEHSDELISRFDEAARPLTDGIPLVAPSGTAPVADPAPAHPADPSAAEAADGVEAPDGDAPAGSAPAASAPSAPFAPAAPPASPGTVPPGSPGAAEAAGAPVDAFESLPAFEDLMRDLPTRRSLRESSTKRRGLFGRRSRPATGAVPDIATHAPAPGQSPASAFGAPASGTAQERSGDDTHGSGAPEIASAHAGVGQADAGAAPQADVEEFPLTLHGPETAEQPIHVADPFDGVSLAADDGPGWAPESSPEDSWTPPEPIQGATPLTRRGAAAARREATEESARLLEPDLEQPIDEGYIRDSIETRSQWLASAVLYEEMTSLLASGNDFESEEFAGPADGAYQPTVEASGASLTRRGGDGQDSGASSPAPEDASVRDAEALRARFSAYQAGTARGRDATQRGSRAGGPTGRDEDEGRERRLEQDDLGSTWQPPTVNDVHDPAAWTR